MKVIISVGGKFHAFHLAQQLHKYGVLERLITSHPRFKIKKDNIPLEKVVSLPIREILQKIWNYTPYLNKKINLQWILSSIFDMQAAKYVMPCDIFVGWSSFSLHTLRKAKSWGVKTILERGSSHIEYQRDILKEEYQRWGLKPVLSHPHIVEKELKEYQEADYISIPSQFVKKTFLEKGIPESKLIHIPYGVDTMVLKPVPKEDNIFRIIYVGGMTIRKGIHYLLKAVSELNLKNFELWLIGNMNDDIKLFFKKYRGWFRYLGHINYYKLYKYYSQGSVFVFPSIDEGLALVILQALACRLPVICTPNSGGADVVRDGKEGFIIPIRDVENIKEKILYLYENPEICQQLGRQAQERVKSNFTWDDYGKKVINTYFNMLK